MEIDALLPLPEVGVRGNLKMVGAETVHPVPKVHEGLRPLVPEQRSLHVAGTREACRYSKPHWAMVALQPFVGEPAPTMLMMMYSWYTSATRTDIRVYHRVVNAVRERLDLRALKVLRRQKRAADKPGAVDHGVLGTRLSRLDLVQVVEEHVRVALQMGVVAVQQREDVCVSILVAGPAAVGANAQGRDSEAVAGARGVRVIAVRLVVVTRAAERD